jgi:cell division FtsZ-interacting protein ZapD
MVAQKSIAKSARGKRSSSTCRPASSDDGVRYTERGELLEDLSAQLALVETASIALQKFEDQQEIGAICASLEHAVSRLADAHERVGRYLRREQS